MIAWFLCVLAISGPAAVVDESVDVIEQNSFYDEAGKPVYEQVIFWDYDDAKGKLVVRAWCLIEPKEIISRRPIESSHNGRFHVRWFDVEQKLQRHISSGVFKRTWTQKDRERENKKILDEQLRIGLIKRQPIDE